MQVVEKSGAFNVMSSVSTLLKSTAAAADDKGTVKEQQKRPSSSAVAYDEDAASDAEGDEALLKAHRDRWDFIEETGGDFEGMTTVEGKRKVSNNQKFHRDMQKLDNVRA